MTDAAAKFALASSPELFTEWTDLCEKGRQEETLRNNIVNFDMAFKKRDNKPIPYLTAKPYDARTAEELPNGNAPQFTTKQIQQFRDNFFALSQSLVWFCAKIPKA